MEVALSEPKDVDADEYVEAARSSRSLHHPWVDPPDTLERFAAYLKRVERDDQALYLVRHIACGGLVGFANLNNIVRGSLQSASLGYAAFASHAGRGLMTEGVGELLALAFGPLELHRVEAHIQPSNERSLGLVQRLGFEKEGYSRGYLRVAGEWRDHERWALRAETWGEHPDWARPNQSPAPVRRKFSSI